MKQWLFVGLLLTLLTGCGVRQDEASTERECKIKCVTSRGDLADFAAMNASCQDAFLVDLLRFK